MSAASGLELDRLQSVYHRPAILPSDEGRKNILPAILDGDPHKKIITIRRSPDGPTESELISGR